MSEENPPPNPLENRRRVSFEPMPMPFTGARGKTVLFVAVGGLCAAAAAYMFFVQHMPWTDMRVIAPAVGAIWFALRLFMTLTPRT